MTKCFMSKFNKERPFAPVWYKTVFPRNRNYHRV